MVLGWNPKSVRGIVLFWQKLIFFLVFPVIHVQMKGSRLSPFGFLDFGAKWRSLEYTQIINTVRQHCGLNKHYMSEDQLKVTAEKNVVMMERGARVCIDSREICGQKSIKPAKNIDSAPNKNYGVEGRVSSHGRARGPRAGGRRKYAPPKGKIPIFSVFLGYLWDFCFWHPGSVLGGIG